MQCREMEIKYRHREEIESETRKKKKRTGNGMTIFLPERAHYIAIQSPSQMIAI